MARINGSMLFQYDCEYFPQFVPQVTADRVLAFCNSLKFHKYPYRGQQLKRSPKVEFKKHPGIGVYRWGQAKSAYDLAVNGFPAELQELVDCIADSRINHIIVIQYSDGKEHHVSIVVNTFQFMSSFSL